MDEAPQESSFTHSGIHKPLPHSQTAVLLTGAVAVIGIFVVLLFVQMGDRKGKYPSELPVVTPPSLNHDVLDLAKINDPFALCNDMEGEELGLCRQGISDGAFFDRALAHFDVRLCDEISNEEFSVFCTKTVMEGREYVRSQSPETLADIAMHGTDREFTVLEYETLVAKDGLDSAPIDTLVGMAFAYINLSLVRNDSRGELLEKAENILDVAIRRDGRNPKVFWAFAHLSEVREDYASALSHYDSALALDSQYLDAIIGRGHVYSMLGMLDRAVDDFEMAAGFDVERKNSRIYSNLCRLFSGNADQYDKAIRYCKQVLEVQGVNPVDASQAHVLLALLLQMKGESAISRAHMFEAETMNPRDVNIKVALAKFYRTEGDFTMAKKYAEEALAIDTMKTIAYTQLAYATYRLGEYKHAIDIAEKGLLVADDDISLLLPSRPSEKRELYYILANIYHVTGDNDREIEAKRRGDEAFEAGY